MLFFKPVFVATVFVALNFMATPKISAQKLDSATILKIPELQQQEVYNLLAKAKLTQTAGFVTLITGVTMFVAGTVLETIEQDKLYRRDNYQKNNMGILLMVTGGLAVVSFPFVLAQVHVLRNRARAIITLNNSTSLYPPPNHYRLATPVKNLGVGVLIPLGR